tara:strand:+ start:627 stop:1091 length:465 start_codon:yes stop_codon:yes gene_type:complete
MGDRKKRNEEGDEKMQFKDTEELTLKEKIIYWREIKDEIDQKEALSKPFKDELKRVNEEITKDLSIAEDEEKSEIVSVDGAGTCWKERVVTMKVSDYQAFQKFCTRNDVEFVLRRQLNLGGVQEIHRMVMEGQLPMPKSAEFDSFEKLTIRKKG